MEVSQHIFYRSFPVDLNGSGYRHPHRQTQRFFYYLKGFFFLPSHTSKVRRLDNLPLNYKSSLSDFPATPTSPQYLHPVSIVANPPSYPPPPPHSNRSYPKKYLFLKYQK